MVKQKDFDKLKQLDRIELILRQKRLEEKEDDATFNWWGLVDFFLILCGFMFLLFLGISNLIGVEKSLVFLKVIPPLLNILVILAVVGTIYNLFIYFRFKRYNGELLSKYFKEEIKVRK